MKAGGRIIQIARCALCYGVLSSQQIILKRANLLPSIEFGISKETYLKWQNVLSTITLETIKGRVSRLSQVGKESVGFIFHLNIFLELPFQAGSSPSSGVCSKVPCGCCSRCWCGSLPLKINWKRQKTRSILILRQKIRYLEI